MPLEEKRLEDVDFSLRHFQFSAGKHEALKSMFGQALL